MGLSWIEFSSRFGLISQRRSSSSTTSSTPSPGDSGAGLDSSGITPYADPSMSITLKPGKVASKMIQVYNFTGTSGTTQYVNHTISVDGCAGYAEARAYTTVVLHDNVMDSTETLWGKPFSLG